jgi:phosphoribosylglycinamide formyltransferase-1
MKILRLAIVGSTRGTDMLALIDAVSQQRLSATIELVISNKENAIILERARTNGLKTQFVAPADLSRDAYDQELSKLLHEHQIDLVVLIGYMRILSATFVKEWQDKIINVHPSLLPLFAGGMNNDVHAQIIKAGLKETGCTVHRVTDAVDQGPILVQKSCVVLQDDTVETLKARVQELEGVALIEAIQAIAAELTFNQVNL